MLAKTEGGVERGSDRIAGAAMVIAALGTVAAMAHHPSGAHSGGIAGIVHGTMIVLLAAMTYGFSHLALRRGIRRSLVLAGLVAYAISLLGHAAAATINGFAVPALAARGSAAVGHDIFLLAWELNQALAKVGLFATAVAFILWSADFIRRGNRLTRLTGAAGMVAGALPAVLVASGSIEMNVAGALTAYSLNAVWTALVGWLLWSGRLGPLLPCESEDQMRPPSGLDGSA